MTGVSSSSVPRSLGLALCATVLAAAPAIAAPQVSYDFSGFDLQSVSVGGETFTAADLRTGASTGLVSPLAGSGPITAAPPILPATITRLRV